VAGTCRSAGVRERTVDRLATPRRALFLASLPTREFTSRGEASARQRVLLDLGESAGCGAGVSMDRKRSVELCTPCLTSRNLRPAKIAAYRSANMAER